MICDNCIHNAVCEREHFENHCGYKHTEADIINPKLEKIKENIKFIAEKCLPNNLAEEFEVKGLKTSIEIIDRELSKLKGEN